MEEMENLPVKRNSDDMTDMLVNCRGAGEWL
jgi:hypothetical protein